MKKRSPLGVLLGDSASVLLKAIQKSDWIAHHVRWRSWHGGQVLVGIHLLYARRRARPIGQHPGFDSCMRGVFELALLSIAFHVPVFMSGKDCCFGLDPRMRDCGLSCCSDRPVCILVPRQRSLVKRRRFSYLRQLA